MEFLLIAAAVGSFALGGAMTWFAWGVIRTNRSREAARVQLLSSLAFPQGPPVAAHLSVADELGTDEFGSEDAAPSARLFTESPGSGAVPRRAIALAAVGIVMLAAVTIFTWMHSATSADPVAQPVAGAAPGGAARELPLELLTLHHSATSAGFVVNGKLRNPARGETLHDVVAVVDVFDPGGRVVTTARVPIGSSELGAGESATFSVALPGASSISRYRVEFQINGRDPIPHVDLRAVAANTKSE
jgi:hypothetical protein